MFLIFFFHMGSHYLRYFMNKYFSNQIFIQPLQSPAALIKQTRQLFNDYITRGGNNDKSPQIKIVNFEYQLKSITDFLT